MNFKFFCMVKYHSPEMRYYFPVSFHLLSSCCIFLISPLLQQGIQDFLKVFAQAML